MPDFGTELVTQRLVIKKGRHVFFRRENLNYRLANSLVARPSQPVTVYSRARSYVYIIGAWAELGNELGNGYHCPSLFKQRYSTLPGLM